MSAEQIFLERRPELRRGARHSEVTQAFAEHEAETRRQVEHLKAVFDQLGEKPERTTCRAAEGLRQEHEALREEGPTPEVLEMGTLGGAAKTEHDEIATSTTLVQTAKDLGEEEVSGLLGENLAREKAMAKRVEALTNQVGKAAAAAG